MAAERGQILYALIARGIAVLTECTTKTGNFAQVTRVLLNKIPREDDKMSYIYENYVFHYIVEDGITYLCMANASVDRQIAFHCLDRIKAKFKATYGDRALKLIAYSIDVDFKRVLSQQMENANNTAHQGNDKLAESFRQIADVKEQMIQNIDKVLDRGEKIDLLVDQSENLNQHANEFRKKATEVRRKLWWQNCKYKLLLFFVVCAVIYIIAGLACGFDLQGC